MTFIGGGNRVLNSLFVAWRPTTPEAGWRPVGQLTHDGLYRFWYTRGARKPGFRPFQQMDRLDGIYESEDLFPLFANRLLSKSRPEYESYLRWSGLHSENQPDPIVVLGVTEGIRKTDAVEVFPCPAPDAEGCYFNKFFLHGIRWVHSAALQRIEQLANGDRLKLMLDIQNEHDGQAVGVLTDTERMLIGYVPRYLAHDVWQLVQKCDVDFIELSVDQVNADAPLQNRVLCRMHACWPDDFKPCSGDDFQAIRTDVPAHCGP